MSYVRLLPFVLSNEDNTFTGVNTFENRTVSNYAATLDNEVPNLGTVKSYVGSGGFRPVNPVRAYVNTNLTLSGTQTVLNSNGNSIALIVGDKVCVSNQTTPLQNARYVVQTSAWTLDTDCVIGSDQKYTIFSETSTGNQFQCTSDPGIVGTDVLNFVLFAENTVLMPDNTSIVFTSNVVSVKDLGISTAKVAANAVTYAKIQQASASSLLGNSTGSTANVQEITLGSSLSFTSSVLNTAQSILTSATPTFVSLVLSGLTANQAVATDASKNLISIDYSAIGGTSNLVSRDSLGNTFTNNFISKTTFVTSASGITSLTPANARKQVLIGTQNQIFVLPDATQLILGTELVFVNNSTGLLSIEDNTNASLTTIVSGGSKVLSVTDISTAAGVWDWQSLVPKINDWGTAGLTSFGFISSESLKIRGSSSGVISILSQAAAGTYNFNLPVTPGTSGQILTSAGGGSSPMTWTDLSSIGVTTLTGDVDEVLVNGGAGPASGAVTLSTPQKINITSNVQFGTLSLGSSLVSSAILSLTSTTSGFLPPRMITADRDLIVAPATGLTIYNLTNNDLETYNGSSWVGASGSGVTSISGVTNRTTVSSSTGSVTIDIASTYVGQTSLTTLGTIATGVWQGTIVGPTYGGTGFDNGSRTIDLTSGGVGKILASDASGNATYSALTGITVTSAEGVANQVRVSGTTGIPQTGNIILSLPQDIATTSLVTFGQVNIGATTQATQISLAGAMTGTTAQYPISVATTITPSATGATGFGIRVVPTFNIGTGFTQTLAGGLIVDTWSVSGAGAITTAISGRFKAPTGATANIALAADNLNIGFATSNAISAGLMVNGQAVFGTNTIAATTKVQITAQSAYGLAVNGTQTGSDGSNYQYGILSSPTFSPFSGTYLTVAVAGIPTFSVAAPDIISDAASFRASNLFTSHTGVVNKAYGYWYDGGGVLSAGSIDYQWGGYFAIPAAGFNRLALYAKNMSIGDDTVFPTSGNLAVSGQVKTATLMVTSGAVTGYVLTSDSSGIATWQASTAAGVSSLSPIANQIYLSSGTGAINVGLTDGISLGSYQATAPPAGGILCNGNVIIGSGTTSGGVLTVRRSTDGVNVFCSFPSTGTFQISQYSGIQYLQSASAPVYIGTSTAHNVFLQTNNAIMTRFDTNGGVAIGGTYVGVTPVANGLIVQGNAGIGTSSPLNIGTSNLTVGDSAGGTSYLSFNSPNASQSGIKWANVSSVKWTLARISASNNLLLYADGSALNTMFFDQATGRVGIGTTNIGVANLTLGTTSTPGILELATTAGLTRARIASVTDGSANTYINFQSSGGGAYFNFTNNATEIVRINFGNTAGMVIGTSLISATPPTDGLLVGGKVSINSSTNTGSLLNLTAGDMAIYEPANTARFIAIQRSGATLAQLDTSNAGCSLVNPTGTDMYFTNSSGTWGNWRGTGLAIGNGTSSASSLLDVYCGANAYTACARIIGSGAEPALGLINTSAGGRSWYLMSTGTGSGGPPGFGGFRIFNSLVGDTLTIRSDGLVYVAKQFSQGQSTPATYTFHSIESASSYSYGVTLSGSITAVPGVANAVGFFNAITLLGPNSSSADLTGAYLNCPYTAGTGTANNFFHSYTGTGTLSNTRVTNGYQHYIDALGTGVNRYGLRVLRPQTSGATIACTASFDVYVGIGSTNPQSPLHLLTNGISALLRLEGGAADSVAISFQQANVQKYLIYVSGASSILRFNNGTQDVMSWDGNANIICNGSAISPSATNGFIYMPSCAGVPSGVPTSYTGRVPFVYDTTNNRAYIYNGGWKQVTLT